MCNNSLLYLTTITNASVPSDGLIPLANISRKRGNSITQGFNSAFLNTPGYYKITATVTFTAPEAGDVTIALQKRNENVPGITASTTITTATTEVRTLTLSGIIRVFCNEGPASITLVNTGVAIDISNVSVDIEYLD